MRTQVGIVGAGPAGLMLSHLLHLAGISSIVIEDRSRAYCEARVRAGLMENWVAQMLIDTGVGERLQREAMVHDGIYISFKGEARHIDFHKLIGKQVFIYDQKEVVTDLIGKRLADGGQIFFEVSDTSVHDFAGSNPKIRFRHEGKPQEIECDFIGGCDGFHGICRPSFPAGVLKDYDRVYPFGWLGILSESPPPDHELIYCFHERGFALFSMRGPELSRLYVQVPPDEDIETMVGPAHLGRAGDPARRRAPAQARQDRAEGHHANAKLRHRADAVGPAVSRRRRRPYRAADRRQGHEPGDGGRSRSVACDRGARQIRPRGSAEGLFARPVSAGCGRVSASPGG